MPLNSSISDSVAWLHSLDKRAKIHDIYIDGCLVRWRQWGSGDPLVLIHGGSGNWAHWAKNIDCLSNAHTLLLPDVPSFGDSDALAAPSDSPNILTDMVGVLSASLDRVIGNESAIDLCGFSFGGLVAGTLSVHRKKIRKLALLGTAGHGGPKRKIPDLVNWRVLDRPEMLEALRHNLKQLMLYDHEKIDDLALSIHEQASSLTRFNSKSLSMGMDLKVTLAEFNKPILLVWGEHDVIAIPELASARLIDGHPERKFHMISDAGHWVQYEAADRVNSLLMEWFEQ